MSGEGRVRIDIEPPVKFKGKHGFKREGTTHSITSSGILGILMNSRNTSFQTSNLVKPSYPGYN